MTTLRPGTDDSIRASAAPWAPTVSSPDLVGCCQRLSAVTTRSGRSRLSALTAFALKPAHSRYWRFNRRLRTGMSTNGQDTFTNVTSRQPFWFATSRRAGYQCDACESPTSAIVLRLRVGPDSHVRGTV